MERYKKEGNSTGMYDEFPGMRRWAKSRMESVRERDVVRLETGIIEEAKYRSLSIVVICVYSSFKRVFIYLCL